MMIKYGSPRASQEEYFHKEAIRLPYIMKHLPTIVRDNPASKFREATNLSESLWAPLLVEVWRTY